MYFLHGQYLLISLILSISLVACKGPETSPMPPQPSALPTMSPSPTSSPSTGASAIPTPQPSATILLDTSVEIVAGSGEQGFQDGPAKQASFGTLTNLCHDPNNGKLYILDRNLVRVLNTDGNVKTLAGTNESGYQDGTGTAAHFNFMADCVVDAQGQVLIVDQGNRRIRKMTPEGQVTTLAGNGEQKTLDGPLLSASFRRPESLALADNGDMYVSDGFYIRQIKDGHIDTLNLHQKWEASGSIYQDGNIRSQATFSERLSLSPHLIENKLYIADGLNEVIRQVNEASIVNTFSIRSEPGPSNPNGMSLPQDLVYHPASRAWLILEGSSILAIYKSQGPTYQIANFFTIFISSISLYQDMLYFIVPEAHQIQRLKITDNLLEQADVISR